MLRIALIHDNFAQMGGAERVAEELYNLLPSATLFSTLAVRERLSAGLRKTEIHTSWMQHLPSLDRYYRHYFLLYPWAVESIDLSGFDLVISSCFGYAKGVRQAPGAVHVCYCYTPPRWVWRYEDYAAREGFGLVKRAVLPLILTSLKKWDLRAAQQPDFYVTSSRVVAERIKSAYGREATIIPPPINVARFHLGNVDEDYYLVLSRLVPYKRIDLAVEACTRLNRPLVVIGDGPDRKRLEKMAGSSVQFLGRQSDSIVEHYASRCRALLFTGEEDFGIAPLEINAAGRPVIAYRAGGATETVIEGVTGLFFDEPTSNSIAATIEEFEQYSWNRQALRGHAESFDRATFASRFLEFLNSVVPSVSGLNALTQPQPPSCKLNAKLAEQRKFVTKGHLVIGEEGDNSGLIV